jgi:chromosome segregation ATPase
VTDYLDRRRTTNFAIITILLAAFTAVNGILIWWKQRTFEMRTEALDNKAATDAADRVRRELALDNTNIRSLLEDAVRERAEVKSLHDSLSALPPKGEKLERDYQDLDKKFAGLRGEWNQKIEELAKAFVKIPGLPAAVATACGQDVENLRKQLADEVKARRADELTIVAPLRLIYEFCKSAETDCPNPANDNTRFARHVVDQLAGHDPATETVTRQQTDLENLRTRLETEIRAAAK